MDELEKSWQTLEFFNRSGRMGPNGDIEKALSLATESLELNDQQNGIVNDANDFLIPELPSGRTLVFKLLTTWGDPFYVGLNGIEVFTDKGTKANIESIVADYECDISETPVCVKPENLLNGNYKTKDETRLWVTRFDNGAPVTVTINFSEDQSIAMIRIWNYNKSRVHASRGVRQLEITLDEKPIFKGEISRAAGLCETNAECLGDTILFTTDDAILEAISENDVSMHDEMKESVESVSRASDSSAPMNRRPSTGDQSLILGTNIRQENDVEGQIDYQFSCDGDNLVVRGKVFHMELRDNWGSPDLIGLTGFQFLGRDARPLAVTASMLQCSHPNNVNKLVNGRNLTTNQDEMWLASFNRSENDQSKVRLTVTFPETTDVIGISFWNYNASPELSYAGVRSLDLYVNSRPLLTGILLRKAPGFLCFDFVQDIFFEGEGRPPSRPMTCSIRGFVYQLQLLSTWGDEFYIGLNGIELIDNRDRPIKLGPHNLAAFPESVNVLPAVHDDPRTSDKLIDGYNDMQRPEHMWLAPILPNQINRIFIIFDSPTVVSKIVVYNYRKTFTRGVRDISVSIDDLIVFSGEIDPSTEETTGILTISLRE